MSPTPESLEHRKIVLKRLKRVQELIERADAYADEQSSVNRAFLLAAAIRMKETHGEEEPDEVS